MTRISSSFTGHAATSPTPQKGKGHLFDFLGRLRGGTAERAAHTEKTALPKKSKPSWSLFRLLRARTGSSRRLGTLHMEMQKQGLPTYRREVTHWQQARALRYNSTCPLTYALQEVYADTMLDTHLSAVISNRVLRLQNRHYIVKDKQGKLHAERTHWLENSWFQELISHVAHSLFYGYSLIWIKEINLRTKQLQLELVDRRHVVPERGVILENMRAKSGGLRYKDCPNELLYAQLGDAFGLLEKAAPLITLKRHSWGNWDEFEQIFGLPIRIARVPNLDTADTQRIAQWLEQMGTAAYAVLPDSAQVEIKESRRTDAHEVFKEKILCVNSEISKLVNGQTMTVDSGSSRSQSEVHAHTENEITRADMRNLLCWLNTHLIPILCRCGYGLEKGDRIEIWDETPTAEKIVIDKELLRAGVRLSSDYLTRTYGVVLEDDTQQKVGT